MDVPAITCMTFSRYFTLWHGDYSARGVFGSTYPGPGCHPTQFIGRESIRKVGQQIIEGIGEDLEGFGEDKHRGGIAENGGTREIFIGTAIAGAPIFQYLNASPSEVRESDLLHTGPIMFSSRTSASGNPREMAFSYNDTARAVSHGRTHPSA